MACPKYPFGVTVRKPFVARYCWRLKTSDVWFPYERLFSKAKRGATGAVVVDVACDVVAVETGSATVIGGGVVPETGVDDVARAAVSVELWIAAEIAGFELVESCGEGSNAESGIVFSTWSTVFAPHLIA